MEEKKKNTIYQAFVVTSISVMLGGALSFAPKAYDAIENRTFDSHEQKVNILKKADEEAVITEGEKERIMGHLNDTDRHMSSGEKEQLIIIRENQKRIGQDLQEIKNLLRR